MQRVETNGRYSRNDPPVFLHIVDADALCEDDEFKRAIVPMQIHQTEQYDHSRDWRDRLQLALDLAEEIRR